jgi:large subunit ribosomal protein L35
MNKPVYRHLARKKWEGYRRKIQVQRIQTMKVVPDVVPRCDPIVDITLAFGRDTITPGEFVNSSVSESPPRMKIQSFDRGEKLFTVAVVDPDVPNIQTDTFDSRCHFLATNISITPTNPYFDLSKLRDEQIMLPWIPPTSLKGSPYHRISIILLQHKDNVPVDREAAMANLNREDFSTRSLMTRHMLNPIVATLFRVKWDDTMAAVMNRHNIPGANVELKRQKVEPLPYQRRRGNFR